jgi:hypothetical protein
VARAPFKLVNGTTAMPETQANRRDSPQGTCEERLLEPSERLRKRIISRILSQAKLKKNAFVLTMGS